MYQIISCAQFSKWQKLCSLNFIGFNWIENVHTLKALKMLPCVYHFVKISSCSLFTRYSIHQFDERKRHKAHFLQSFFDCLSTFMWQRKRDLSLLFLDTPIVDEIIWIKSYNLQRSHLAYDICDCFSPFAMLYKHQIFLT